MTDDTEDEMQAALFWAIRHPDRAPEPSAKTLQAQSGKAALNARMAVEGSRALTRDAKRLQRHYDTLLAAYEADVLEAYRNR